MSLTNFSITPTPQQNNSYTLQPHHPQAPLLNARLSLDNAPSILRTLGRNFDDNLTVQVSDPSLPIDRIKTYEESNQALKEIFVKINDLIQETLEPGDIAEFTENIQFLENRITQLAKKIIQLELTDKESKKLLNITKDFKQVLSSMQDWFEFQHKYTALDRQLNDSLDSLIPSIYSDLHGWSPAATTAVTNSLNQMSALIQISEQNLQDIYLFTPEMVQQLYESIHAGTWQTTEWLTAMSDHYQEILTLTEEQWHLASQQYHSSPSAEAYTQMQLAAQQLLSMEKMLTDLENIKLPPFEALFEKMTKIVTEEYGNRKLISNIKNDIQDLANEMNTAKKQIPEKREQLRKLLSTNNVLKVLTEAQKQIPTQNYSRYVKHIVETYQNSDRSLENYVSAKCQLTGISELPGAMQLFANEFKFLTTEENRFNQHEEHPIDFNELVLIETMKRWQPQPSLLSRAWQAIAPSPSEWSDTTKQWVNVSFTAYQLFSEIGKVFQRISENTSRVAPPRIFTRDEIRTIDRERAFLGMLLGENKYTLLRDKNKFEHYTKRFPHLKPFVKDILNQYSTDPTPSQQKEIMNNYVLYRQNIIATERESNPIPPPQQTSTNTHPQTKIKTDEKTSGQALPNLQGIASSLSKPAMQTKLSEMAQQCNQLDLEIRESQGTLLSPALQKTLTELNQEASHLRQSISETRINQPSSESTASQLAEWQQTIQKQAHALSLLENRIEKTLSTKTTSTNARLIPPSLQIEGVKIPLHQEISNRAIFKFLQSTAPEIFEQWSQLKVLYSKDPNGFLENQEAQKQLKSIENAIKQSFAKIADNPHLIKKLDLPGDFPQWLENLNQKDAYLVVKSANPHIPTLNSDITYVQPTQMTLCQAIGAAVSSYFSVEALKNCLSQGLNPLEIDFNPHITIQEIIGEKVGGTQDRTQIPVSVALRKSEPLYIGDQKFRAMHITATPGHKNGLNNSEIANDTALVLVNVSNPNTLFIHYDNPPKPQRIVPVKDSSENISLQCMANDTVTASQPTLNHALISQIYEWGIFQENNIDTGGGTEIVVKEGTIYPVEADFSYTSPTSFASFFNAIPQSTNFPGFIFDQNTFKSVKEGDWVFFSHVNKMTHVAITSAQRLYGFSSSFSDNITHVGVVTETTDKTITVAEIAGNGYPLAENIYQVNDLYNDEELLFTSPKHLIETHTLEGLDQLMKMVGKIWTSASPEDVNEYNLQNIIKIPATSSSFTDEDKKAFAEALTDYLFLRKPPQNEQKGMLTNRNFYCSEFAHEVAQFARLLQKLPLTPETIIKEIERLGLDFYSENGRAKIAEYFQNQWEKTNLWKSLLNEPLFKFPARQSSPSNMLDLALRYTHVVRVRNPEAVERFNEIIVDEKAPEFIEYRVSRLLDRYLKGEQLTPEDPEVVKLLHFLEHESKFSRETLDCFIQTAMEAGDPTNTIESCLEGTLVWQEKLAIFILSREINRAVEQLIRHPLFIEFLNDPLNEKWKDFSNISLIQLTLDHILDESFPLHLSQPLTSAENIFATQLMKSLDRKTIIKYLPLSLAYYPPTQEVTKFLDENHIDLEKLAEHLYYLLTAIKFQNSNQNAPQNTQLFMDLLFKSGTLSPTSPWIKKVIQSASKSKGYSEETISCITDKIATKTLTPDSAQECLINTLTYQEQANVFMTSQFISLGVENLIRNEAFLNFIHTGQAPPLMSENKEELILDLLFPTNTESYGESAQNYAGRIFCSSGVKNGVVQFVLKDIFLGLGYAPTTDQIKEFLARENLDMPSLVNLILKFIQSQKPKASSIPEF